MKFIKDIIDGRSEYVTDDDNYPVLIKETSPDCWEAFFVSDVDLKKITDEELPKNRKWKTPTSNSAKKAKERVSSVIKFWESRQPKKTENEAEPNEVEAETQRHAKKVPHTVYHTGKLFGVGRWSGPHPSKAGAEREVRAGKRQGYSLAAVPEEEEEIPETTRCVNVESQEFQEAIERARNNLSKYTGKERRRLRSNLSQLKRGAKKDWVIPMICGKLECSPEHLNHILAS